jgi:DNA-directed RNA polymerase specialized sigma24 family protein
MWWKQVDVQGKSSCFDQPYISALQEGDSAAQEHLLAYFRARYAQIPELEEDPEDVRVNLDLELVTEERRRIVLEILRQLPERDRELLRLAVFEDTDRDELCRRWGVGRQYLRVLVHRASLRLRAALRKEQNATQRKAGLARVALVPLTSRRGVARPGCSRGR